MLSDNNCTSEHSGQEQHEHPSNVGALHDQHDQCGTEKAQRLFFPGARGQCPTTSSRLHSSLSQIAPL
jgi:hypothetical protein